MPDTLRPLVPVPFREAIAWAKARQVVLPEVYYGALQGLARSMAFSIAGLAKLDQLQAVLDSLVANLESGESFGKWKTRVAAGEIPLDLPPHRIENIFRTNIQGHYGRGRCEQQKRTVDSHPWYLLDAVNDSRTRPSHAAMDGKVARHDDPWWNTHTPPNGYQCRCRRIALSEAQAPRFIEADRKRLEKDPKLAEARALADPDKGWDYSPCAEPDAGLRRAWAQKVGKAHPVLVKIALAVQAEVAAKVILDGMETAYQRAQQPGRPHHGWLQQQRKLTTVMLQKGIRSLEKQIERHQTWIEKPYLKFPADNSDPEDVKYHQERKWPADIARQRQLIEILEGVIHERDNQA